MKKILVLLGFSFGLFFLEVFSFNLLGKYFLPNLLLLFILFSSLEMPPAETMGVALCSGLMKDSFSIHPVAINTISFFACAFLLLFVKKWIFHEASQLFRFLLVLIVCVVNFFIQFFICFATNPVHFGEALRYVLFPELLITLLMAPWVFKKFEKCVLKLFV